MNIIAVSNNLYELTNLSKKSNIFLINNQKDFTYQNISTHNPDYIFFPHWARIIPGKIFESFNCVIFHWVKELLQEIRNRKKENRKAESNELKQCMIDANKIIGIEKVFSFDCPGNRFGSVPLLDIVKVIEKVKINFNPNIIFTHFAKDMKLDHVITNRAVLTATRPMSGETVKEIYAFEVLSSTEWNFPLTFSPDYFVDITSTISKKQSAMKIYKNELRDFPHPRSLGGIELNAKYWRIKIGLDKCEAFQMLRKIWDSPLSWMIRVPKISHLYMLQEHAA